MSVCIVLEYDRTDISEGIDVNKAGALKECDICHYFKDIDFSTNHIFAMAVMI